MKKFFRNIVLMMFFCCVILPDYFGMAATEPSEIVATESVESETEYDVNKNIDKHKLLIAYSSFGAIWHGRLCTEDVDGGIKQLTNSFKKWTDELSLTQEEKKIYFDLLNDYNIENDVSALEYFVLNAKNNVPTEILSESLFCLRIGELEDISLNMFNGKKNFDTLSSEDYTIMSYTSFLSIWPIALFKNQSHFHGIELFKSSINYFAITNKYNLEFYSHLMQKDLNSAKVFFYDIVLKYGNGFTAYLAITPFCNSWIQVENQAYDFFK